MKKRLKKACYPISIRCRDIDTHHELQEVNRTMPALLEVADANMAAPAGHAHRYETFNRDVVYLWYCGEVDSKNIGFVSVQRSSLRYVGCVTDMTHGTTNLFWLLYTG